MGLCNPDSQHRPMACAGNSGSRSVYLLTAGLLIITLILGLFWLKDRLASPLLARIAYSALTARLAVIGGAFSIIGILQLLAEFAGMD